MNKDRNLIVGAFLLLAATLAISSFTSKKHSHRGTASSDSVSLSESLPEGGPASSKVNQRTRPKTINRANKARRQQKKPSAFFVNPDAGRLHPIQRSPMPANTGFSKARSGYDKKTDALIAALQSQQSDYEQALLAELVDSRKRESNFLINELGLSQENYRLLRDHESDVNARLSEVAKQFPANSEALAVYKEELMKWHISWMENFLGPQNYARLLEISEKQDQTDLASNR